MTGVAVSLPRAGRNACAPGQDLTRAAFLATLLVLGAIALVAGFLLFVQRIDAARPLLGQAQGVVALTGGADRIAQALDVLASGRAERLLITGVNQSTTRGEIARLTPQFKRLFACCIDLGYAAQNTIGNAVETRDWARAHHMRSLIVVTADYHMPRALVEIGSALPEARLTPCPVRTERDAPLWTDQPMLRLFAFEYVKYLAALVRTRLMPQETRKETKSDVREAPA